MTILLVVGGLLVGLGVVLTIIFGVVYDEDWAPLLLGVALLGLLMLIPAAIVQGHRNRQDDKVAAQECVARGGTPYRGDCLMRGNR